MSNDTEPLREAWLARMAVHVLAHGLNDASLRPLARAAGTSDRMLLYYFGTKEKLVASLLLHLADLFRQTLDSALPIGRFHSDRACVVALLGLMRTESARGFLRVWFDLLAASARGSESHRETGGVILRSLQAWMEGRLPERRPDAAVRAAELLMHIEGMLMAEEFGMRNWVEAAVLSIPD